MNRRTTAHLSGRLMARLHLACMFPNMVLTQACGGEARRAAFFFIRQALSNCCRSPMQRCDFPLRTANHERPMQAHYFFSGGASAAPKAPTAFRLAPKKPTESP